MTPKSDVDYEQLYKDEDEIIDGVHSVNTFDSNGTDTMVFLHIQKTGGTTLGTRLVNHIGKNQKYQKLFT